MNREELRKYIGITGYSLGQVEKDYFQHIILGALSRKLSETLVFKGGTALQKLGLITRFSEDLDFTINKELKIQKLQDSVTSVIQNYNYITEVNNYIDDERTIGFRIKIQGPLYRNRMGICTVRLEASKRERVLLAPVQREFAPPYFDILPYIMNVMHVQELLAEKIRAIYVRQKARDLYDAFKILETGIKMDIDLANMKLEYYNLEFDHASFLKKCEKLKPNWERELQDLMEKTIPYQQAFRAIEFELSNV